MDKRTVGIIATIASVLLCACPGLFACVFGALITAGVPVNITNSSGQTTTQTGPLWLAITLLCVGLLLVAVPVVVGFLTLRNKPASQAVLDSNFNEPLPPAS